MSYETKCQVGSGLFPGLICHSSSRDNTVLPSTHKDSPTKMFPVQYMLLTKSIQLTTELQSPIILNKTEHNLEIQWKLTLISKLYQGGGGLIIRQTSQLFSFLRFVQKKQSQNSYRLTNISAKVQALPQCFTDTMQARTYSVTAYSAVSEPQ